MSTVEGVEIAGPMGPRFDEILTPRALELIALLHRELDGRRLERLQARNVGIQYVQSWLRGQDAAGINGLMEDAATAEISRSQVWQWLDHGVTLSDGQQVSGELVHRVIDEEMAAIAEARGDAYGSGRWDDARALFTEMALAEEYNDLLTVPAYERMP